MGYTSQTSVAGSFDDVIDTTIEALAAEGFGVLSDIDVQETFEERLGEEFRQYRILGACNPNLAFEGLSEDIDFGALLPCKVVVYETEGAIVVSTVDPQELVGITENEALESIASTVSERFERVLSTVTEELGSAQ
ncbi:MAG: DUF302 domain-containing protein [Halodesulfurarchaeum sp.]